MTSFSLPSGAPSRPISLTSSLGFLLRHPRLLGLSLVLILITGGLAWLGSQFAVDLLQRATGSFFTTPPTVEQFWQWPLLWGWTALKWLFAVLSRVVAFYLAFVLAYTLTTPGYALLSAWAGDRFTSRASEGEAAITLGGLLTDLWEGVKIGGFGLLVSLAALLANGIPLLGQAAALLAYVFYSALLFIDFPAARYRWTLGAKLRWLWREWRHTLRLGLVPALISLVPFFNIFVLALLFPLFTVHATLLFLTMEGRKEAV